MNIYTPEPGPPVRSLSVRLGTYYRITAPESSWGIVNGLRCCSECGDTLTFVFLREIDPSRGWTAADYWVPVAVRCKCFTNGETKRAPIPIEAEN
jgi:hypothetical protein